MRAVFIILALMFLSAGCVGIGFTVAMVDHAFLRPVGAP